MRKLKVIASVVLLLVFLIPSIAKIQHHHKYSSYNAINEKPAACIRDNCPICNFEFSVFIPSILSIEFQNNIYSDNFCNHYNSSNNSNISEYAFSLRGPPLGQI